MKSGRAEVNDTHTSGLQPVPSQRGGSAKNGGCCSSSSLKSGPRSLHPSFSFRQPTGAVEEAGTRGTAGGEVGLESGGIRLGKRE